ncbi:MAG: hypothetical protein HOF89_00600 [Candidatus Nitrosopelagicus sp.]|nr:hypothetical protein [Candidatus Nitrosopelagicus sp.]
MTKIRMIINGLWYDPSKSITIAENGNNFDWIGSDDLRYYRETLEVTKKGNLFLYVWSSIVHDHKITPIDKKSAITWCSEKRANIEDSKLFEKFVGKIDEA